MCASLAIRCVGVFAGSSGPQHTEAAPTELRTDNWRCLGLLPNLPILQAFLYQINGYWS